MLGEVLCKNFRVVNYICQYLPVNAALLVNAVAWKIFLFAGSLLNLVDGSHRVDEVYLLSVDGSHWLLSHSLLFLVETC